MRVALLASLLLLSTTAAYADQAYIQANAWAVNRLPVMPGQSPHARCILQTTFSGNASIQFIAEGQRLRGVILILTEPVFKEEGREIDVNLLVGKKAFELPAKTLSKYAVAVEISDAHEAEFRKRLAEADVMTVKTGFKSFNFSMEPSTSPLEEALVCTPPKPPEPKPVVAPAPAPLIASPDRVMIGSEPRTAGLNTAPKAFMVPVKGRDVPVADALPQMLPPGYKSNIMQGASGAKISWEAGSDWLETLIIALDDVDLQAAVTDKTVTILPKIKSTTLAVTSTTGNIGPRADVIVKEPNALTTDMTKPPSPGMKSEADALLNKLRLEPLDLEAISNADAMAGKPLTPPKAVDKVQKPEAPKPPVVPDVPKPDVKGEDAPPADVFAAAKGERVADVLARWAHQSDTEVKIDLQRDYFVSRDIKVQGGLDLAVEQVLTQFNDLPEKPRVGGEEADKKAQAAAPVVLPRPEPTPLEQRLGVVAGWNAVQGTSLRAALTNWTRQAQMDLVWLSPDDMIIAQNVSGTKRLEDALDALLSQYDDAQTKPNIQVNRDPDTGRISMIVDVQPFVVEGKPKDEPVKAD